MARFLSIDEEAALELLTRAPAPALGSAPRYPAPRPRPRRLAPPEPAALAPDLAPSLTPPDSPASLALAALLAGELYVGFEVFTAAAGEFPSVVLFNPGFSNRGVIVLSIVASAPDVISRLQLLHLAAGSSLGTFVRRARNLALGQPGSLAEVSSFSGTSTAGSILGDFRLLASTALELLSTGALELVPGEALQVRSQVGGGTLTVTFIFRESLLV